jgi:hypothetical protein
MELQIGDIVRFLNEEGQGEVKSFPDKKHALVLREDGIEVIYLVRYLVPFAAHQEYQLPPLEESKFIKAKLKQDIKKANKPKPVQEKKMEVDLHMYELVKSTKNLTNGEMLQMQLRHFHTKMKEAQAKRLTKIVFIHGVGEGVLRSEIRHELRKYENVEFLDGDYREYGQGATEVRLWYK